MKLTAILNMGKACLGKLPERLDFSGVASFFAAADEAEASEVEDEYGERIHHLFGTPKEMKLPEDSIYPKDKIGLIMAMMDWSDVDPLQDSFNRFYTDVQLLANEENRGVITLDIIKRTTRRQTTAMKNDTLRGNTSMFLFALTQSAKTILMLLTIWKAGIIDKSPSIVFSFNRKNERSRYVRSVKKLNQMIDRCGKILGMPDEEIRKIPRISFSGNDMVGGTDEFIKTNKKFFCGTVGDAPPSIPVHVALTNPANVVKVREMFEKASYHMNDDRVSKKNCNVVFEEGDLSIKDVTTKLHRALYVGSSENEVNILTEPVGYVPVPDSSARSRTIRGGSFMDGFTSQMFVTATPQIFAQVKGIVGGRQVKVVKASPSTNYWSFVCGSEFGCKTIGRKDVDSYTNMLADFYADEHDQRRRIGLACVSGNKGITTRTIDNQKILARSTAENYPRMVSVAWNGTNVHVYTQRQDWADAFGGCGLFHSQNVRNGLYEFVGKKKANREEFGDDEILDHICSYTGVTTYMADNAEVTERASVDDDGNILPKVTHICLFSFNMTGRSTPIKSYRHTFGLTDMFLAYSGTGGHDESREEIAGRLSTIDNLTPDTGMKTLWGPKEDNDKLMKSFERLSILLKVIESATTTEEIFANMKEACRNMSNNGVIRDEYGLLQGNCGEGTTRQSGIKRTLKAMERCQDVVDNKHLHVADPEHESEFPFNNEWTNPSPARAAVPLSKPVVLPPKAKRVKKAKVVLPSVTTTIHDNWEEPMEKVLSLSSYSDMNGIFYEHPGFEAYFKGCFELFLSPMGYKGSANVKGKKEGVIVYDGEKRKASIRGGKKKATAAYNAMVNHAREKAKASQDAHTARVEASYAAHVSAALGGGGSGSGVTQTAETTIDSFVRERVMLNGETRRSVFVNALLTTESSYICENKWSDWEQCVEKRKRIETHLAHMERDGRLLRMGVKFEKKGNSLFYLKVSD